MLHARRLELDVELELVDELEDLVLDPIRRTGQGIRIPGTSSSMRMTVHDFKLVDVLD